MLDRLRRSRAFLIPTALGAAAALAFSACGSSSKTAEVASLSSDPAAQVTTTTTAQNTQEQVLKFVACLRDQGLDVPDPKFDADGNLDSRIFERGGAIDPRSDTTRAAVDKCRDLVGDVRLGPGGGRRFDREQMQTAFNDFTSCLRSNGIEVDDITLGGPGDRPQGASGAQGARAAGASGPQGGFGPPPDGERPRDGQGFDPSKMILRRLKLDDTDPKVKAAVDKCLPALTAAMQNARRGDGDGGPDGGDTATTSNIKFAS